MQISTAERRALRTVGAAGSSEGGVLELLDVRTVRLTSDLPERMIRARWCHY